MGKKVRGVYSPREFKEYESELGKAAKPSLSELRLRSPRTDDSAGPKRFGNLSPKDLEKGTKQGNSPKQAAVELQETNNTAAKIPKKKSFFVKGFVLAVLLIGGVFGVLLWKNIISFGNNTGVKSEQVNTVENNYVGVPMLSEQNFSLVLKGTWNFTDGFDGFLNFTFSQLPIDSSVIRSFTVTYLDAFNQTQGNFTRVNLWFSSYNLTSNQFRDNFTILLTQGKLAEFQVLAFGEGKQVPRSFCGANQFGPNCQTCSLCNNSLVCDSGTMGSGMCVCKNVFVTDIRLFNRTGAALPNRCLALSSDQVVAGAIAVEKSERILRNLTVRNIGSTPETFVAATVQADEGFSEIVGTFISIASKQTWPITLAPGNSLTISIAFEPKDIGNFTGNVILFVDNILTDWVDDANTAVRLSFDGTIGGQYPINGRIQQTSMIYKINCGSAEKATWNSVTYDEDAWFSAGSSIGTSTLSTIPILRTFRTFSSSGITHYTFPIRYPGSIKLTFRFMEHQFTTANSRRFHISVNNQRITNGSGIDIFALVGRGKLYNVTYDIPENPAISQVTISFVNNVSEALVNAIELQQTLNITAKSFLNGVSGADINYAEALHKSYLFFESLYSGNFTKRRLNWRNNSCLLCKGPEGQDLSGGYYEAGGNYLKMSFPMSWTMTMVGYGILEHKRGHIKSEQLDIAMKTVRWAYDYLIKCRLDENRTVLTIGQAFNHDFKYHGPPELYQNYVSSRTVWLIQKNKPFRSSETMGEIAAALAVGSIIFKESDPAYSAKLIAEAKEFFKFGSLYPGSYMEGAGKSEGFTEMSQLYPSVSYKDELAWGAAWIYRSTGELLYLQHARSYYMQYQIDMAHGCGQAFSWDEKGPGLHVLLSQIDPDASMKEYYDARASEYFNSYLPGQYRSVPHTPKGLAYIREWGSTRYAANTAYLALIYSKYLASRNSGTLKFRTELYKYGQFQMDYILGKYGRSMMAGMGAVSPQYLLHKSSYNSILYFPRRNISLNDASNEFFGNLYPQIHIPYGAIIGGPIKVNGRPSDFFVDERNQYIYTEPGLDFAGASTAAIAALAEDYDVTPISDQDLDLGWNFIPPR